MISSTRNRTTAIYQPFQLLKKGALSLSGTGIYFLVSRNMLPRPISTPSTKPIINPIRTFLISIPMAKPNAIATIKAISPLRIPGFFSSLMGKY
jgi:hypothetical protein